MKSITLDVFNEHVLRSHPNAFLTERDGVEVAVVPTWDFETDTSGEIVYKIVRQSDEPKFKAGDVLRHTVTGSEFVIVDPLAKMLKLRKGPTADGR